MPRKNQSFGMVIKGKEVGPKLPGQSDPHIERIYDPIPIEQETRERELDKEQVRDSGFVAIDAVLYSTPQATEDPYGNVPPELIEDPMTHIADTDSVVFGEDSLGSHVGDPELRWIDNDELDAVEELDDSTPSFGSLTEEMTIEEMHEIAAQMEASQPSNEEEDI